MTAGLLQIQGTIDVSQFWPKGRSDASDFLDNGVYSATPFSFASFIKSGKTIPFDTARLVFEEAPSKLMGADGKEVTTF